MFGFRNVTYSLLLVSASYAFVPSNLKIQRGSSSNSNLHVSVVSEFLSSSHHQQQTMSDADRLKAAFETNTPESVGVKQKVSAADKDVYDAKQHHHQRKNQKHRKHNYAEQEALLSEEPDLAFFTLHSSAISHLYKDISINDITRAIKRAQNLHDTHDLKTIGAFLMEECDENWGYGFRGTLLSRLAVAALHINEVELALQAIETRKTHERPSMKPFESAGIVRGLLRAGLREEGWTVLEDELRLPMQGSDFSCKESQEALKYRAHALSSFATRYFYQGQPEESERALQKLGELGTFIEQSAIDFKDLNMPWVRLEVAASECTKNTDTKRDLREAVWNAMAEFPCPGNEEECSLEAFFMTP